MAEECAIVKGARFKVAFCVGEEVRETEGCYMGMAAMGTETALVFETSEGISFINCSDISAMVQTCAAPEEPKKKSDDRALYG